MRVLKRGDVGGCFCRKAVPWPSWLVTPSMHLCYTDTGRVLTFNCSASL